MLFKKYALFVGLCTYYVFSMANAVKPIEIINISDENNITEKGIVSSSLFYEEEKKSSELTPYMILKNDPYCYGHIANMLMKGDPGKEKTMENACLRWDLKTRFLTPQEAFEGYILTAQDMVAGERWKGVTWEKYSLGHPDHIERIFSSKYFLGNPGGTPEERKEFFQSKSIGFLNPEMIQVLYEGAHKIMNLSQQGDYLVFFGNSPAFLGHVVRKVASETLSESSHRHLIFFPFSGHPNGYRWHSAAPNGLDLVNLERFHHLKERLKACGLTVENPHLKTKTIHFIDIIASGGGCAYVMEELLRDFKKAALPWPSFHICSMNVINIENPKDPRNALIAEGNTTDGGRQMLTFPSKENPHFRVPATVTFIEKHNYFDVDETSDWRLLPSYNAALWESQYDHLLTKPQPQHIQFILEYLEAHLEKIQRESEVSKK